MSGNEIASRAGWHLADFTGAGYDKGRPKAIQALWLATSGVIMHWWFPTKARVVVLRAFGAQIGDSVLIRHRVRFHADTRRTDSHRGDA